MSSSKLFIRQVNFRSTTDALSATDGNASVSVSGGLAVGKSGYFGSKVFAKGVDAGTNEITNVGTPTSANSAATKAYVDASGSSGVDDFSLETFGSPAKIRISNLGLGSSLTGGSGLAINVNPNLSLQSLSITNTTAAASTTSGALTVSGGISSQKGLFIGGFSSIGNLTSVPSLLSLLNPNGVGGIYFEAGAYSDGTGVGFHALNFNGYHSTNPTVVNVNKNRWRLLVDQRGASDIFAVDTFASGATSATSLLTITNAGLTTLRGPRIFLSNSGESRIQLSNNSGATSSWLIGSKTNADTNFRISYATTSESDHITLSNTGVLSVANTTDATSATAAATLISGGLGIGKSVWIGDGSVTPKLVLVGVGGSGATTSIDLSPSAPSMNPPNCRLLATDDGTFGAAFAVQTKMTGALANALVTRFNIANDGIVTVSNTTAASSTVGGSFQLAGGATIAKALYVSGGIVSNLAGFVGEAFRVRALTGTAADSTNYNLYLAGENNVASNVRYNFSMTNNGTTYANFVQLDAGVVRLNNTVDSSALATGSLQILGGASITKSLVVGGLFTQPSATFTDTTTVASGTLARWSLHTLNAPTLAASNTGITTTIGSTVYISGAPIAGTNETLTNSYSLEIGSGKVILRDTADTSSSNGASFQSLGGISAAKNVNFGSNATGQHTFSTTLAGADTIGIRNNDPAGYSAITFYNSAGVAQGSLGFANTSATSNAGVMYMYSSGNYNIDTNVITVRNTTDTTSASTGAMQLKGGLSVSKSLYVGNKLMMGGSTSGSVSLVSPAVISSPFNLVLPSALPTTAGMALVSDLNGNLSFSTVAAGSSSGGTTTTTTTTSSASSTTATSVSFSASNPVTTPTAVTGQVYSGTQFAQYVLNTITSSVAANSSRTLYLLQGVYQPNTGWSMTTNVYGPNQNVIYTIDANSGQLYYTSSAITGWTSSTFTFYPMLLGSSSSTFTAANPVTTAANVTNVLFSGSQSTIYVLVTVASSTAANNTRTLYLLQGINQPSTGWIVTSDINGPEQGIAFSVNASTGQLMYTSTAITGWTSTTFSFFPMSNNTASPTVQSGASFLAANNVTTAADVTGLTVTGLPFVAYVNVNIISSTAANSVSGLYLIQVFSDTSGTGYVLTQSVVGTSNPGITFSVTSAGQIQYISPNVAGFTSSTFLYRVVGVTNVGTLDTTKALTLSNTTDSTSTTTGAIQVAGGASIGKTLTVGSGIVAPNTNMYRNRLINGSFLVNQRGISTSTTNGAFMMDRWQPGFTTGAPTFTWNTNLSNVPGFLNGIQITTPSTVQASTGYIQIRQVLEGYHIQDLNWGTASAMPITIQFWVFSSTVGTFCVSLRCNTYSPSYVAPFTVSTANTWQKIQMTIPGCTTGSWQTGSNFGLDFAINVHGSGTTIATATPNAWITGNYIYSTTATDLAATANANIYFTGIQLEAGTVASTFELRPYVAELQLCQRYYERVTFRLTGYPGGGTYVTNWFYKANKRVVPTVNYISSTAMYNNSGNPWGSYGYAESTSVACNVASTTAWLDIQGCVFDANAEF